MRGVVAVDNVHELADLGAIERVEVRGDARGHEERNGVRKERLNVLWGDARGDGDRKLLA